MSSSTPPTISGYRLGAEIGRGGMGVVYRAERILDGVAVAVKVIHPHLCDDPAYRRRLRAEARRAAAVRHPGIVGVLDVGDHAASAWIAMELVEGPDLNRLVAASGPLPPPLAADLVAQTAETTQVLHEAGLIHRDLKPANVLVEGWTDAAGASPLAKLADFGIAHPITDADPELSEATDWAHTAGDEPDAAAGTRAYMAPEQWSGGPLSPRTDVYALGATLYTALTGHRPFPQVSLTELAYAVANNPPPAPSWSRPSVPAAFDAVVARAMAKSPADRYADAAAFAQAVRGALRPDAQPPARPGRARRRPRLAIGAVAAGTVAVALLLWAPWSGSDHATGHRTGAERTLRRTVCPKGRSITLRDQPGGTSTHELPRGTKVTEYLNHPGGRRYWRWVRADNGATGWGLTNDLRSSCNPR